MQLIRSSGDVTWALGSKITENTIFMEHYFQVTYIWPGLPSWPDMYMASPNLL